MIFQRGQTVFYQKQANLPNLSKTQYSKDQNSNDKRQTKKQAFGPNVQLFLTTNKFHFYMKILVTGTAGFIGYHLAKKLLERGDTVVGLDNINDYYDTNLKYARLAETGIGREAENWHTKVQSTKYPN